jgi:hypothetical protein
LRFNRSESQMPFACRLTMRACLVLVGRELGGVGSKDRRRGGGFVAVSRGSARVRDTLKTRDLFATSQQV